MGALNKHPYYKPPPWLPTQPVSSNGRISGKAATVPFLPSILFVHTKSKAWTIHHLMVVLPSLRFTSLPWITFCFILGFVALASKPRRPVSFPADSEETDEPHRRLGHPSRGGKHPILVDHRRHSMFRWRHGEERRKHGNDLFQDRSEIFNLNLIGIMVFDPIRFVSRIRLWPKSCRTNFTLCSVSLKMTPLTTLNSYWSTTTATIPTVCAVFRPPLFRLQRIVLYNSSISNCGDEIFKRGDLLAGPLS